MRESVSQTINMQGRQIDFNLIRSSLAHNAHIKISPVKGMEVVVPARFNLSNVPRLLHEKQDWIFKNLQKMEDHRQRSRALQPQFKDGLKLEILGIPKTVRILPTRKKRPFVKEARTLKYSGETAYYDGHEILIFCDGTITQAKKALEVHLRAQAEKYLSKRTSEISLLMGVSYNNITIRGQKTRWGSCSRDNNLNYNWRLVLMPLSISDYVIIHELAHTVHHNHSKRFYALVEKFCPDYKALRKQLRLAHFAV